MFLFIYLYGLKWANFFFVFCKLQNFCTSDDPFLKIKKKKIKTTGPLLNWNECRICYDTRVDFWKRNISSFVRHLHEEWRAQRWHHVKCQHPRNFAYTVIFVSKKFFMANCNDLEFGLQTGLNCIFFIFECLSHFSNFFLIKYSPQFWLFYFSKWDHQIKITVDCCSNNFSNIWRHSNNQFFFHWKKDEKHVTRFLYLKFHSYFFLVYVPFSERKCSKQNYFDKLAMGNFFHGSLMKLYS